VGSASLALPALRVRAVGVVSKRMTAWTALASSTRRSRSTTWSSPAQLRPESCGAPPGLHQGGGAPAGGCHAEAGRGARPLA